MKPSDLLPPSYPVFRQTEGGYEWNGQTVTADEYRAFMAEFEAEAIRRDLAGLPTGYVIMVSYCDRTLPVN